MKILVFGPHGQVGRACIDVLANIHSVTGVDRHATPDGGLENPSRCSQFVRKEAPDVVINAAAFTAVDKAESSRDEARIINAIAPGEIAQACKAVDALLIHYSSDYVFSGEGHRPWTEADLPEPVNYYGQTKLLGEQFIADSGCANLVFRTSWVFSTHRPNFLRTILKLARERDTLDVVGDQWGAPTGAALIADLTAAMIKPGIAGAIPSGIYHLTASGVTNWCDYARHAVATAARLGYPMSTTPDAIRSLTSDEYPTPARRPHNSRLDCTKLVEALQLEALPAWEAGVEAVIPEICETLQTGD